jgi:hypothetical protein
MHLLILQMPEAAQFDDQFTSRFAVCELSTLCTCRSRWTAGNLEEALDFSL